MFLKSLTISNGPKVIRDITFRKGLNLIVDERVEADINKTGSGNGIGKTTVLKLIDFCLGGDAKSIYTDSEDKKENAPIRDFLKKNKTLIALVLKENLDIETSTEIVIERNFLNNKAAIRRINQRDILEKDFEAELLSLIFPNQKESKPSFRQLISHNIRYEDNKVSNTLKTLHHNTTLIEYSTLHLFMLGCEFADGDLKQSLTTQIQQETIFKRKLEKNQSKNTYETALSLLENDVKALHKLRVSLNLNENIEKDLEKLNNTKYEISKLNADIGRLNIRKKIIIEAKKDLEANITKIDVEQLNIIYQQATQQVSGIQKTFEDLVQYHNQMIVEKVKFITQDLPTIEVNIQAKNIDLKQLISDEKHLTSIISKSVSFEELEKINNELYEKYKKKGEYETIVKQLDEVEKELGKLNTRLSNIDKELFSEEFQKVVKSQKDKFNKHFASISTRLYGEQYALTYDIRTSKTGQRFYVFSAFNANFSSGTKQGEIACFEIAYILFADNEKISCLHFLLNDKKELMDGNQLVKIAELANEVDNIQIVDSILKDKLPEELKDDKYVVLKLSPNDKLFRIP
jgi:uncharacterized protein YydD (DUF2326 family)